MGTGTRSNLISVTTGRPGRSLAQRTRCTGGHTVPSGRCPKLGPKGWREADDLPPQWIGEPNY